MSRHHATTLERKQTVLTLLKILKTLADIYVRGTFHSHSYEVCELKYQQKVSQGSITNYIKWNGKKLSKVNLKFFKTEGFTINIIEFKVP